MSGALVSSLRYLVCIFTPLTIRRLQVVSFLRTGGLARVERTDEGNLENLHDSVEQSMYDLETSFLIRIKSRGMPVVSGLALFSAILHGDVRGLEDFEW